MLFSNAGAMAQGAMPHRGSRISGSTCSAPSTRSKPRVRSWKQAAKKRRRGVCHHFIGFGGAGGHRQSYGPIKAALIHMAKGLARQYAGKKIRVNVVSPGTVYFKGGIWTWSSRTCRSATRTRWREPDRPHGDAAGNCERRRVPGEPGFVVHDGFEPRCRWRDLEPGEFLSRTLMVRSASSRVSNHEARGPSLETPLARLLG